MKGDNCQIYRVGTFRYFEKNKDTAEWRSEQLANHYEARKAEVDTLMDIFECDVDLGLTNYSNNMIGIY